LLRFFPKFSQRSFQGSPENAHVLFQYFPRNIFQRHILKKFPKCTSFPRKSLTKVCQVTLENVALELNDAGVMHRTHLLNDSACILRGRSHVTAGLTLCQIPSKLQQKQAINILAVRHRQYILMCCLYLPVQST